MWAIIYYDDVYQNNDTTAFVKTHPGDNVAIDKVHTVSDFINFIILSYVSAKKLADLIST